MVRVADRDIRVVGIYALAEAVSYASLGLAAVGRGLVSRLAWKSVSVSPRCSTHITCLL